MRSRRRNATKLVACLQTEEAVALAEKKGILLYKAWGMMFPGAALALRGETENAICTIKSGIALARSTGSKAHVPICATQLAIAYLYRGKIGAARLCLDEANSAAETTGEKWFEGESCRVAGEIELKSPERDAAKAEGYFERAIEIARAQQARSFELRAATSLARLWRDHGRSAEARDLLSPIYGWFTEGFDTPDLVTAKSCWKNSHRWDTGRRRFDARLVSSTVATPSDNDRCWRKADGRSRRIAFSNGSRAGPSSGCRRFRVPAFSACSFGT